MSGKPASVGAPRAGDAAGRVLLLLPGPRRPPDAAPGAPRLPPDYANHNAIYYKPLSENDPKLGPFPPENTVTQRTDFFPVSQPYLKEQCVKLDDSKVIELPSSSSVKQNCAGSLSTECGGVETFQSRTPLESGELITYQTRCPDAMPPMQPLLYHGQNQFSENITVQSGSERINGNRDLVGKNYVNYQFLEQSVSHQSIVNQSISILNQQVGVSKSVGEEDSSAQLVRTPDGVVLAVLPSPQDLDPCRTASSDIQTVTVPLGWRRIVSNTSVLYISPSGTALSTLPQLREYLQTAGTCKCGLPCPLRPETTFSFDPKVASKPYQPVLGAELTKLCNHKRKLLASLQARAQSPATPPPVIDQKKVIGLDVSAAKKKMKKRPGFPANMSVSQMMVQRERPLHEFKPQDNELSRTVSPGIGPPRLNNGPPCLQPYPAMQQNVPSAIPQDNDVKQDTHVQRSSHYLTVNNGWITQQQENLDGGQKPNQPPIIPTNSTVNVGLPVLGNNGQIIGVNTAYNKQTTNFKNVVGVVTQNIPEQVKEEKKDVMPLQHNVQQIKDPIKEESQIFCGLNQPLTPEVMQKINEQQQLFIQQNQKQIELAMKGYRSQIAESSNQNKAQSQNQFVHQGQLVIQNGTLVKTNPAKTPPWQVKRNDSSSSSSIASPSPKQLKSEGDYDESNISEESEGNSFSGTDNSMNPAMCSRVPPLPQHYNMMGHQWPAAVDTKKKVKNTKSSKKKANNSETIKLSFGSNGVRIIQDSKGKTADDVTSNNVPSFMDDPSGYLAQQTVLLNNTISRQVMNQYESNQFEASNSMYASQHPMEKLCKTMPKSTENMGVYRNSVPNPSPSPNNIPDSSLLPDRGQENPAAQCCKGCHSNRNYPEYPENQMRLKYSKHMYKMDHQTPSPKHGFDESPVTSTFVERSPPHQAPASVPASPSPAPSPGHSYPHNSPGPPNSISGTQMMHFISNHNVNKNLMEVDNISMVGVKPGLKPETDRRRKYENSMPGYCPPPHLGGGPSHTPHANYMQSLVTTMASGFSVTRDTVTSVLAGRAQTATTSVNAAHASRTLPPNPSTAYAIPAHHPDPFLDAVNLPTSYPLHIAGTTAQNMISKSPLEMVQNVIGSLPSKTEVNAHSTTFTQVGRRPGRNPGQILISSTGQIMVSNNQMPPPPPKTTSSGASSVASAALPLVPPAMMVNTLSTPFVIQPPVVAVDGQIVGGVLQSPTDKPYMLSPESVKKKSKKKKNQAQNITSVLQINAPQQNAGNIMVHHTSPQNSTSPQFSPRGFQLSPNNNISPTPMLQALTIVPGKSGTPAHIVMNGQGGANNFGSPQIIANTSPSQQINLLQPVNLINNGGGVVPNFPAFQQFIVPNLSGMVMTADGTAIIQDNSTGMPMQLQLQTVNGQNVLTPVQNTGVFAGGNNVVIRAQNQQGKIIQSQHSPGAQFLSPNSQVMMNSPNFNGQLSPLLANLSPTNVTFNTSPHQVRTGNVQTQEFIQTNQMGQTLMVPMSPKQVSMASATSNRSNSTFVQQNTTIVQQQTTLVSNSHNAQMSSLNLQGNSSRLSIDPNILLHKQIKRFDIEEETKDDKDAKMERDEFEFGDIGFRQSVSTQTLVNQQGQRGGKSPPGGVSGSSPPDTTTHSPLGAEPGSEPRLPPQRCLSTQGNYADTTTKSPEPADASSSAMVQCVSSSEQDMAESREHAWATPRPELHDNDPQSIMPNMQMMRQNRAHNPVESTEMHYNQNMNTSMSQHVMPMAPNYYDRPQYKRKNEFGDAYRSEKMMRTNYGMVHGLKEEYDSMGMGDKARHYPSGSADNPALQKIFDRHNMGSGDDVAGSEPPGECVERRRKFEVGDLVWGPVKGYASWPGKLQARGEAAQWRVRWFGGDKAPAYVDDDKLLTLSEGLEAHHAARTKHRKSRKLNTHLENAIQEAMAELDKKSEVVRDRDTHVPEVPQHEPIAETPKRKKQDKVRKDKQKKGSLKLANKPDVGRLRSSR